MATKNFSYEDMQTAISKLQKDCENIRSERQKDYGFHFYDNYNKYGIQGFLINDGEITARLEQICSKISEKQHEIPGDDYCLHEKSLRNALYDGINYRLLFLFWLEREKWDKNPRCYFNENNNTQDANFDIVSNFVENENKTCVGSGIKGNPHDGGFVKNGGCTIFSCEDKGNSHSVEDNCTKPPRGVGTDNLVRSSDIDLLPCCLFSILTPEEFEAIRKLINKFFKE
jgi:hypothetical protein